MSLNFKIFQNYPCLKYGLSQKTDGPMELAGSPNFSNRKIFLQKNGFDINHTVSAKLAHSENISEVYKKNCGTVLGNIDGLITKEQEVVLTVTVADCFPIYFYSPKNEVVGLIHSGWRGSVSNLIFKTVKIISSDSYQILVGVGAGIGPCHFEIKSDILNKFKNFPSSVENRGGKLFVNLPNIIKTQLESTGVLSKNIEFIEECTFCAREKYFSFRRDKPPFIQAMLASISL